MVIGTEATVSSHAYRKALEVAGRQAREKASRCWSAGRRGMGGAPVTEQVARIYLSEAFADGFHDADALVWGGTHYPLLKPLPGIALAPPHVSIVDSAESTARVVADVCERLLPPTPIRHERCEDSHVLSFSSPIQWKISAAWAERFLGHPIEDVHARWDLRKRTLHNRALREGLAVIFSIVELKKCVRAIPSSVNQETAG